MFPQSLLVEQHSSDESEQAVQTECSNLTSQNGLLVAVDDDVSYKEQS
jgi:hypothetical protein